MCLKGELEHFMNLSYETLNMLLNGWMDWIHITSSAQSSDIASQSVPARVF